MPTHRRLSMGMFSGINNSNLMRYLTIYQSSLLQIWNFWAAASAAFLVDRLGRRTLFKWSGIGMLISFSAWTACSAVFDIEGDAAAGKAVVAFIFIYVSQHDCRHCSS